MLPGGLKMELMSGVGPALGTGGPRESARLMPVHEEQCSIDQTSMQSQHTRTWIGLHTQCYSLKAVLLQVVEHTRDQAAWTHVHDVTFNFARSRIMACPASKVPPSLSSTPPALLVCCCPSRRIKAAEAAS